MDIEEPSFLPCRGLPNIGAFSPDLVAGATADRNLNTQTCSSNRSHFIIKLGYRIYALWGDTAAGVPGEKQYFDGENILQAIRKQSCGRGLREYT